LILGILIRQRFETGRILVVPFLQRRALRLIPSTIAVVSFSAITLWLATGAPLFAALEFRDAAAALVSMENFYLIFKSEDYLASDQLSSPFTHFWSLGVEEQFYLFAAIVLALSYRSGRISPKQVVHSSIAFFAVALTIGFVVSDTLREVNSAAAYFNPVSRIWEFAIGGLAAVVGIALKLKGFRVSHKLARLLSYSLYFLVALFISLSGLIGYRLDYPGWESAPILITLSMALLTGSMVEESEIAKPSNSRVRGAILFLGKRSYVIYLWHLPVIFLFSNILQIDGLLLTVLAMLATLLLAAITGWTVEDRFRFAEPSRRNIRLLSISIATPLAISLILAGLSTTHLKQQAANMESIAATQAAHPESTMANLSGDNSWAYFSIPEMYRSGCHSAFGSNARLCVFGSTSSPTLSIALVGDSHATQLAPGLKIAAEGLEATLYTLLQSSCSLDAGFVSPGTTASQQRGPYFKECQAFTNSSLGILKEKKPDVLILAAASLPVPAARVSTFGLSQPTSEMLDHLKRELPGTRIVVFEDPPRASLASNLDLFYCVNLVSVQECPSSPPLTTSWDRLSEIARGKGIEILSIRSEICASGACAKSVDGWPVYRDSNHLNAAFSIRLAPYWTSLVEDWILQRGR
jgi:peptidoglycan/LPS O-acetylase OafA/YrhL